MQTEKKNLGKRERILLFLLILVALLAVMIMWVIIPLYDQLQEKQAEHSSLLLEKSRIDTILAAEDSIREERNNVVGRHDSGSARYLHESHSSEIGRMLTMLCQQHGLIPVDQKLEDPVDFVIPDDDESNGSNEEEKDTVFLITSATMSLNGQYADLMRLLNAVEDIYYIRISKLSYTRSDNPETMVLDKVTVGFEVTMIKDIDYSRDAKDEDESDEEKLTLDYS